MKYINESRINGLLEKANVADAKRIDDILAKSRELERLTLEEAAVLLGACDKESVEKIFRTAAYVKNKIYGPRVVLFAPLYISNFCSNNCLYCAFKADNTQIERRSLNSAETVEQTEWLLKRGHKRILVVSGEAAPYGKKNIDHYVESIEAVYSASVGPHRIKRVNINCAPLATGEFRRLKAAGIGTFQIFQETYHEETYRRVHPRGPKSDPDNRLQAISRAFEAGIDDIGIGALFGLYDHRFEVLGLLSHVEAMESMFGVGPHTISVPRIEPAVGLDFEKNLMYRVSDDDFRKVVAVLRLAVPYTGMILSTREEPFMRDELFSLGISQVSAESRTSPGGYDNKTGGSSEAQFELGDKRTLDEIIVSLVSKGFIPSFCAACYRKARTGEAFMNLAKPGTIKGKCQLNALITLKEYLDDFGSIEARQKGYKFIEDARKGLDAESLKQLDEFYAHLCSGVRDEYV